MRELKMRNLVAVLAIIVAAGCGSSRQRKANIQKMQAIETDVHGLHILVSAGITKQEYSQRVEDVLLKAGNLDQEAAEAIPQFPQSEQDTVKEVYDDLSQALAAYTKARDYFGDSFVGYGCEDGCSFFQEKEYNAVKQEFTTLAHLDFGPEFTWYKDSDGNVIDHSYRRSDMLQALWAVAAGDDEQAAKLIEALKRE